MALKARAETILPHLSGGSELAKVFRSKLLRWTAPTRVFDNGRIALDNNSTKRARRSVAIGRKNYPLAGSGQNSERPADVYPLIETANLNVLDPKTCLRNMLTA